MMSGTQMARRFKQRESGRFKKLGIRKGGGKTYRAILGGAKRTIKHPLQNQFWRPQKVGFVWSVPVSSKETDIAWTKGGGEIVS